MIGNHRHRTKIEDVVCANVLFENGAFGSLQLTINQPKGYSVRQIVADKGIIIVLDVQPLDGEFGMSEHIRVGMYDNLRLSMTTDAPDVSYHPAVSWKYLKFPGDHSRWQNLMSPKILLQHFGMLKLAERPLAHASLMDSFANAILHGGDPIVTAESVRPTVELTNAIILSAMRKKTVDLPLDGDEYDQLFEELCSGRKKARSWV